MKWYGILAFLVLIGGLAGIVYLGANTDKIGINFGEPSFISTQLPLELIDDNEQTELIVKEKSTQNQMTFSECRSDYIFMMCAPMDGQLLQMCQVQVSKNMGTLCDQYK